jgi:peptide chain release factor 1
MPVVRVRASGSGARGQNDVSGASGVTLTRVIDELVDQIETRHAELERLMSDPAVIGDRERYAEVGREYRELQDAHRLALEYRKLHDDLEGARELLAEDGDDPELRRLVSETPQRLEELEEEIRLAMVERDPNDSKNVIVEIRAGTGGDEAALFAGDLYKMLTRYAESLGFATEVLSQSPAEVGGFKDVTFAVKGEGAYSVFKYEGGTHRVQRVPKTESQGRIHTSTATVAVLPEAEDVEVQIDPSDLEIETFRSTGPGGQSVNTTDSAVRITHKPTGTVVSMQDEKSQLQNREKAMRVLRARLYELALAEQRAEIDSERRAQVGTGERSEKIRTYNFPQGRVTDHRVKVSSHDLDAVLAGGLRGFTDALSAEERRRRLEAAADAA